MCLCKCGWVSKTQRNTNIRRKGNTINRGGGGRDGGEGGGGVNMCHTDGASGPCPVAGLLTAEHNAGQYSTDYVSYST